MDLSLIEKHIQVTRNARYYQSCQITEKTNEIFIVFHGYAMHAGFFLKKFEPLFNDENCFIAPEGLSRFYAKGFDGNVVASWMTRESRLYEINDYRFYLENLTKLLVNGSSMKINLIGFSQGCATLARWYNNSQFIAKKIIFSSGTFPSDIQDLNVQKWKKSGIHVLIGDNDGFYDLKEYLHTFNLFKTNEIYFNFKQFTGGHEINIESLRSSLS